MQQKKPDNVKVCQVFLFLIPLSRELICPSTNQTIAVHRSL